MKNIFQLHLRNKKITDSEIIVGIQNHNKLIERIFFNTTKDYFDAHFKEFFFDSDSQEEIFQTAIIKLWTEIENKTIKIIDGQIYRKRRNGEYQIMTASLNTFMMAFAKNEFRELLRNHKDDNIEDLFHALSDSVVSEEEDEIELKIQIVDECIQSMSPNCIEIITMFYYRKMSLDEIMKIRPDKNSSKDGLKTAKNKCMVTLRNRVNEKLKVG